VGTIRIKARNGLLLGGIAVLAALATLLMPGGVEAIDFAFTCQIPNTSTSGCTIPGQFGTLSIVQGVTDPNRVDVTGNLTPGFGTALERVVLNYDGPDGTHLRILSPTAPPGSMGPLAGTATTPCNNCQSLGGFGFDIRLSPVPNDLNFSVSLALFDGPTQVPLLPDFFNLTTEQTPTNPGTPPLFAAYRTHVLGGGIGNSGRAHPAGLGPALCLSSLNPLRSCCWGRVSWVSPATRRGGGPRPTKTGRASASRALPTASPRGAPPGPVAHPVCASCPGPNGGWARRAGTPSHVVRPRAPEHRSHHTHAPPPSPCQSPEYAVRWPIPSGDLPAPFTRSGRCPTTS
jgi:hypothetical protein